MVIYLIESRKYSKIDSVENKKTGREMSNIDDARFECCPTSLSRLKDYIQNHINDNYMIYVDKRDNMIRKVATWTN